MKVLCGNDLALISGGQREVVKFVAEAIVGDLIVTGLKTAINGFPPVSSSTKNFGVVGPGSASNFYVSSRHSVNSFDSMSDNASGASSGIGRKFIDPMEDIDHN